LDTDRRRRRPNLSPGWTIPISCANSYNTKTPLEILYQGLAPGFDGVYQIDVWMPSGYSGSNFEL
jgi:uncharacterized protein (TIGR03437 family)